MQMTLFTIEKDWKTPSAQLWMMIKNINNNNQKFYATCSHDGQCDPYPPAEVDWEHCAVLIVDSCTSRFSFEIKFHLM